jgi:DNA-binding SARP family transcriptional activator
MRFRILGPLEIQSADGPVEIKGVKRSGLLAALLMHPGHVVSTDRLVDTLWEESPPRSATSNIRTYVADLRAALGRTAKGDLRIAGHTSGYLIRVEPAELDWLVFERLADLGEAATRAGDTERAARSLERAASLWRGRPLGGIELGSWARARITALEDRHWAVLSSLVDAQLQLGRCEDALVRLRRMVAERPLCERARAQLMVGLDLVGRKAEALAVFARGRKLLACELGLEPGPELREVQSRILAGRRLPSWNAGRPDPRGGPGAATPSAEARPRCLPAAVADFVGREQLIRGLIELVGAPDPGGRTGTAVAVVSGPPGAGKTAAILRAAHRLAPRFPDGQLYETLGGATDRPRPPEDVLADFLRALGVATRDIPAGAGSRASLFRSMLADRRMLIVLDDAADAAQIRPLLPGAGACGTLVSSRTRPAMLEGAHLVSLGALGDEDATALLSAVAGSDRVEREPDHARRIVRACSGSPLALRIAGARLAARPDRPLAVLAGRLADPSRRLDELAIGELSVRASFESGYRRLSPEARRAFRLLGRLRPAPLRASTVELLVGGPDGEPDRVVEDLLRAHLLTPVSAGESRVDGMDGLSGMDGLGGMDGAGVFDGEPHYRVDELLHLYARERAEAEEPPERSFEVVRPPGPAWHAVLPHRTVGVLSLEAAEGPRLRGSRARLEAGRDV